jgi:multidrug resistance efflux pump
MAEESEGKKFLDRLKEASVNVAQMTREGVETLQTKRELSQAYGDLGRTTAELVDSGAITHPELTPLVEQINELKARLEAEEGEEAAEAEESPPAPEGDGG